MLLTNRPEAAKLLAEFCTHNDHENYENVQLHVMSAKSAKAYH